MHRFLIVIEKTDSGFSAYSPDLDGCVASGSTQSDTENNMHQAIEMHINGMKEDKEEIPESTSFAEYVTVG